MTDLLRAEDAQRQSQNDYWRAAYGNTVAYAALLYPTGTPYPRFSGDPAMKPALSTLLLLDSCAAAGLFARQSIAAARAAAHSRRRQLVESSEQQMPQADSYGGNRACEGNRHDFRADAGHYPPGAGAGGRAGTCWAIAGDAGRCGDAVGMVNRASSRADRGGEAADGGAKQGVAGRWNAGALSGMLKEQKSVSPQEFDEVQRRSRGRTRCKLQALQAQSEQAKAAVAGARTQLGYTQLRAPFSRHGDGAHGRSRNAGDAGNPIARSRPRGPLRDVHVGG